MHPEQIYEELEHVLAQLGVKLRVEWIDDDFDSRGGLCTIKKKKLLIVNRRLDFGKRNALIIECLRSFDLEGLYIKPYVREMIAERQ